MDRKGGLETSCYSEGALEAWSKCGHPPEIQTAMKSITALVIAASLLAANALEDNVTNYHTLKGKRVSFKNVNTPVKSGEWHTLWVNFTGNQFTVTFNDKSVIESTDNSLSDAGKVGVWTKADSVTLFDDFSYGGK
jgi:hypothetical protein